MLINPVLAARCIAESGAEHPGAALVQRVQAELVAFATGFELPLKKRVAAGDALNYLGDPRAGVGLREDGLPDIVWSDPIPPGTFLMGDRGESVHTVYVYDEEPGYMELGPRRRERVPATYQVSRYLITNAQYEAFVRDGGYTELRRDCWNDIGWEWKQDRTEPKRDSGDLILANRPVVYVTWFEAMAFCNWLGRRLNLLISLPTEVQWERAARGTDGRRYPWGDVLTFDHVNLEGEVGSTTAVGIFPKGVSPCGALDMSGNVWEWCLTKWRPTHETSPDAYPEEDYRIHLRVVRGGSYRDGDRAIRCATRFWLAPIFCSSNIGFRVVVTEADPSL
jgi:formylglycine-generating enzyme required for sulfatase activity